VKLWIGHVFCKTGALWNRKIKNWSTVVELGKYEFLIGAASDDIRLKLPMTITAQ
jgi:hypothetical protein